MPDDKRAPGPRPDPALSHVTPALSHVTDGAHGPEARMVDVGAKPESARSALARARLKFPPGVLARVLAGGGPKGPVTEVARAAGILAAKRTGELIPLCHPLGLDHVAIEFAAEGDRLEIRCRAACHGRTGVEMEAMVGAGIAALTVYDMVKALDPAIAVEALELVEKQGGRSGTWARAPG
jgi:cyclic pyranopterin phosphate synthase